MFVYLAGPMSGLPDFNFPMFFRVTDQLRKQGHIVFNPAEEDIREWKTIKNVRKKANYRDCLRKDLNWMLDKAEAIAILPGWKKSKGVKVELALAKALGLKIIFLKKKDLKC